MSNAAAFDLVEQVYLNLNQSGIAYKEYLQTGKTFRHAGILRIHNEKIRDLLRQKEYLLSAELQQDAQLLIAHYDIWLSKWDVLKEKLNPAPEDEFIFANEFTFPKETSLNFEKEYYRLKELILPV